MPPTLDVGRAVLTRTVANRNFYDLQLELRSSEEQVEVSERVEIAEVGAVMRDPCIVGFPQDLGPTQGVLDRLPKQPGESPAEKLVAEEVEKTHRLVRHRVDQAHTVDELALSAADYFEEPREVDRCDRKVRVQDHEDIALGLVEAEAYGVALSLALLPVEANIDTRVIPNRS